MCLVFTFAAAIGESRIGSSICSVVSVFPDISLSENTSNCRPSGLYGAAIPVKMTSRWSISAVWSGLNLASAVSVSSSDMVFKRSGELKLVLLVAELVLLPDICLCAERCRVNILCVCCLTLVELLFVLSMTMSS